MAKRKSLHPLVRMAGEEGRFPAWASPRKGRAGHCERVGALMKDWAKSRRLSKGDRIRWCAAGLLHDALKDDDPSELRERFGIGKKWPDPLVHGPACARMLEDEGVRDKALLRAIRNHTTGHPRLDLLGESLYVADYVEPGRRGARVRRAEWRRRLPGEHAEVLLEVAATKISRILERGLPLPPRTVAFWQEIAGRS